MGIPKVCHSQQELISISSEHTLKILVVHGAEGEDSADVSILLEGREILPARGDTAKACMLLMGVIYALNLAHPIPLRYTFEVFQKPLRELNPVKLSPKLHNLRVKLLS
uniref:Uncharacterized protein n=1 Tax=Hippocampus comes TaxID=109280 RepID=A0A3Q2YK06_HIPCM